MAVHNNNKTTQISATSERLIRISRTFPVYQNSCHVGSTGQPPRIMNLPSTRYRVPNIGLFRLKKCPTPKIQFRSMLLERRNLE
jgi:hypothetical protein